MEVVKPSWLLSMAVLLFVVALLLVLTQEHWKTAGSATAPVAAPDFVTGLTALGFAIAGGMALIAAALASGKQPTPPTPPAP